MKKVEEIIKLINMATDIMNSVRLGDINMYEYVSLAASCEKLGESLQRLTEPIMVEQKERHRVKVEQRDDPSPEEREVLLQKIRDMEEKDDG